jgi:hypothetical protein
MSASERIGRDAPWIGEPGLPIEEAVVAAATGDATAAAAVLGEDPWALLDLVLHPDGISLEWVRGITTLLFIRGLDQPARLDRGRWWLGVLRAVAEKGTIDGIAPRVETTGEEWDAEERAVATALLFALGHEVVEGPDR